MQEITPKRPAQANLLKERLLLKISTIAIGSKTAERTRDGAGVRRLPCDGERGDGRTGTRRICEPSCRFRDVCRVAGQGGTPGTGRDGKPRAVQIAYPDFLSYSLFQQVHYSEVLALKRNYNLVNLKLQPLTDFATVLEMARKTPNLRGVMISPPPVGFRMGSCGNSTNTECR